MSVHHRRFASATRTAARKSGSRSRLKLIMTWLTIATALSLFTFTVGAGAVNTKPDYAGAAKALGPDKDGHKVVLEGKGHKKEVCSVNQSQYELLETRYDTGFLTVTVDGLPVELVTVEGAKDHDLHKLLGDMKCKLVKEKHVFYLPFDAQTS